MAVSYKRLWKLLIDKDMKKKDLEDKANISHYTVNKMNRGDNITTDIIQKICKIVKSKNPNCICFVDNCYGEFTQKMEPTEVGADLIFTRQSAASPSLYIQDISIAG